MRSPATAGKFYPGNSRELRQTVEKFLQDASVETTAPGVLAPHAGYPYSGACAGYSYQAIEPAETYVILGPCHNTPTSVPAASTQDWSTPLGELSVDREFVDELREVTVDETPHRGEHSIEVQLPFLQYRFDDFEIVPIAIGPIDLEGTERLAADIDRVAEATGRDVSVVASSDLNHYEMKEQLEEHDRKVYEKILDLDRAGFYEEATRGSVCGFGPILVAMSALGPSQAELLDYRNSIQVTGTSQPGVGYASIAFR